MLPTISLTGAREWLNNIFKKDDPFAETLPEPAPVWTPVVGEVVWDIHGFGQPPEGTTYRVVQAQIENGIAFSSPKIVPNVDEDKIIYDYVAYPAVVTRVYKTGEVDLFVLAYVPKEGMYEHHDLMRSQLERPVGRGYMKPEHALKFGKPRLHDKEVEALHHQLRYGNVHTPYIGQTVVYYKDDVIGNAALITNVNDNLTCTLKVFARDGGEYVVKGVGFGTAAEHAGEHGYWYWQYQQALPYTPFVGTALVRNSPYFE